METKIWLNNSFSLNDLPEWICPSCNTGHLRIEQDNFHFEETKDSLSLRSHEDWEPEFIQFRFHGTLKCKNCEDFISFLGKGSLHHFQSFDQLRNVHYEEYNKVFTPIFFNPPLIIFNVNDKCPEEIKNEIIDSFKLFWNDLPSCANKIRTSLELLMNQQKVKKTNIQKGKRRRFTLHQRIEEFKLVKSEIANFLLAIKWIGNSGSHIGKLESKDILVAYELLEHTLNKLFDDKESELKKKTKEINQRRGIRKK